MVKEGILLVIIAFLAGLGILLLKIPYVSYILAVLLFLMSGFFMFFFRDPHRVINAQPNEIMSPVDGTILDILDEGDTNRIVVFLSVLNIHVARFPLSGKLEKLDYFKGTFLPAYREKASELNERVTLTVTSEKFTYTLRLIAGIAARRIRMWVKEGDELKTGDKIAIIMFGSRAEIILPKTVKLEVKKDQKLCGGLTLIGKN